MSLEDKSKKRTYKTMFIVTLILLIFVVAIYLDNISKNKEENNLDGIKISQNELNQLETQIKTLEQIYQIDDEILFKNNYQETLAKLHEFNNNPDLNTEFKKPINNRITYVENLIEGQKENEITGINLRNQLVKKNKLIDSLYKKQDSITGSLNKISLQKNRKIDSLSNALKKKSQLLNQRASVKVLTFKNDSGNLIRYLGETENEMANGNGVGIWNTTSIYRGEWKNNKRHGFGEFEWSDSQKYVGEFEEDIRTGKGTYYWPSGEKYVGEFKENKRNGQGTFYDPDGNVKFKGIWKNDKLQTD